MDRAQAQKIIARRLAYMAPGSPAARIWGRAPQADADKGAEGNVWAGDPTTVADVIADDLYPVPDGNSPVPRDVRLGIITEAIESLIPGAAPAFLTVKVTERPPTDVALGEHSWTGSPAAVAERVFTALYGPDTTPEAGPLAQEQTADGGE